jgi:hypothetical protein
MLVYQRVTITTTRPVRKSKKTWPILAHENWRYQCKVDTWLVLYPSEKYEFVNGKDYPIDYGK